MLQILLELGYGRDAAVFVSCCWIPWAAVMRCSGQWPLIHAEGSIVLQSRDVDVQPSFFDVGMASLLYLESAACALAWASMPPIDVVLWRHLSCFSDSAAKLGCILGRSPCPICCGWLALLLFFATLMMYEADAIEWFLCPTGSFCSLRSLAAFGDAVDGS
ncbi:hypothetical protein Nepgr_031748 [Nepenthes gracilis]|uniref:Uncharacterized protein n=1 Tax=Nepenthes gracilis TaxID=150966 RepID=A0AAD3THY3_NEPGR|nr:hypothetical protein Nepgr_031748 [Nepenthes gracilis]